ncbi:fibropellin-1-like [Dreissena polymorpha]|uniref:fibropellin-1-like n=1 Tax=Dreissena polymorpha TaxID=45954 RepID=UPI002264C30F|nr:fibropellin-1-like [Dreissena polymorpha]
MPDWTTLERHGTNLRRRPTHGDVSYTDTIVNSRAVYTCTDGFRLNVIDVCEGATCMNGAKCMGATGGYKCVCPTGYSGPLCETDIDECNPNPCIHGSCTEPRLGDFTCICKVGYTGNTCDEAINECIPDPCEHGTCKDLLADYECACPVGYTGKDCSKDIDECFSSPCEHGTCVNLVNSYKCRCDVGYSGANCDQDINECVSNPCKNQGNCTNGANNFTCACAAGWEDIDECVGHSCWTNQSRCQDRVNGYVCVCDPGFNGSSCETNINECVNHDCRNGGICQDGINSYTCLCLAGYTGRYCQNMTNECDNNSQCQNGGTCIDGIASFRCACPGGYTGDFCQLVINNCLGVTACQNGGICRNMVNNYTCDCPAGYTGEFCVILIDECASNPCKNGGECNDGIAKFTCTCQPGFNGILCDNDINECIPNPCGDHGTCTNLQADYRCTCANGYRGRNCSEDIDECVSSPCLKGQCINLVNSYVCKCDPGYEGINCDKNINDCIPNPCYNGACNDQVLNYTCKCVAGYSGRDCDININECSSKPCGDNGICFDGVNNYTCVCDAGWTGTHCQTDINECSPNPCQNGGNCLNKVNAFQCECTAGHTGDTCRTSVLGDSCAERVSICANILNGMCSGTTCECQAGYEKTAPGTCSPVNCGTIAPPEHGSVDHAEGTHFQDKAYFSCNTGYIRNGVAFVTCQNDKNWSGIKPTCEDINECASNPCKNGGACTDKLSGYTCACQQGFGGTNCIRDCGSPASIAHGGVTNPNGTLQGHLATYSCNQGYTLSGNAVSECLSTGKWSEFGECFVVGVAYDETCAVTAQCGTAKATCRNDGLGSFRCLCKDAGEIYDRSVDKCLIDCGKLPNPTNGEVKLPATTSEGQVASYICFVGYGLAGSKFRTCQSDGRWSNAEPTCVFGCPEPEIPANGRVNTTNGLAVGQTIYYSCIEGFELVGQTQRICESASTWSGTEPTCLIQCPVLEALSHGKVDMSWGRHEGSMATYSCENNYALIGDPIMTCQSSGVWGGMQPECVFAMFPDILLAFGSILILLVIVDAFVVGVCVYYRYCRNKPETPPPVPSQSKPPFPEAFYEDGETGVPPRDITLAPFQRKQKFSKVTPEDSHPPPQRVDEPNVVYRSRMKMSDQVLDSIFSKGSKYRRNEDGDERLPYLDDGFINDKGYNTGNSNSMDDAHSEEFDKHLDLTHSTPGPVKSPRETRKPEEPEEEEEDEDRFRFRLRGPPPNIADTLFKEKETTLAADDKRRSKSAFPGYRMAQKYY